MATITEAEATALTLLYLEQLNNLGDVTGAAIRAEFLAMDAYDRANLDDFIRRAMPFAMAGMEEGASLAGAYLSEVIGTDITAGALNLSVTGLDDPFLHYWHDLKEGQTWEQSRQGGASKADMVGHDVVRDGAAGRMAEPGTKTKVIAYQRVVHPGACEFCQVVATQMYRSFESAMFGHHKCRCIPPIPVTTENAAALRKINQARLKDLRAAGSVQRVSEARARSQARERAQR
jgi:hypothetical protein